MSSRHVAAQGGPSRSYLSELENGKKREVSATVLDGWVRVLHVTHAFARGELAKYRSSPDSATGLAADIGAVVTSAGQADRDWVVLSEQERVRQVLRLIAQESRHLSRVVLAWVLDLDVGTLDDILAGQHPIMPSLVEASARLTLVPKTFFLHGPLNHYESYVPVFRRAVELGITPQELLSLVESQFALRPKSYW